MRKCKACGADTARGMSDPHRREVWIAGACDIHLADVEQEWLRWLSDNGRPVLVPELRHPDNRGIDFSARGQGDEPKPARVVSEDTRSDDPQGRLI